MSIWLLTSTHAPCLLRVMIRVRLLALGAVRLQRPDADGHVDRHPRALAQLNLALEDGPAQDAVHEDGNPLSVAGLQVQEADAHPDSLLDVVHRRLDHDGPFLWSHAEADGYEVVGREGRTRVVDEHAADAEVGNLAAHARLGALAEDLLEQADPRARAMLEVETTSHLQSMLARSLRCPAN